MNEHTAKNIYTIPAGMPFAKALASKLLIDTQDYPETLSQIRIFLPTRRACRVIREAFLQVSKGKALLLPRLQALGDIDEEELSLSIAGKEGVNTLLDLPPALSPLRRQLLLAKVIESLPDFAQTPEHTLSLAGSLGILMDQIYTENLSIHNLDKLVPVEFAEHWQITIDFLKILSEHWPKILKEKNVIDGADRRNRLILALSRHWQKSPPEFPVIAAGSTGSIPATAHLLSIIASLPNGQVVLPGVDKNMDKASWETINASHPQYGFKHLCEYMKININDIKELPIDTDCAVSLARRKMACEIMRPAETTLNWITLSKQSNIIQTLKTASNDLTYIECDHEREEAQTIALLMREILEEPEKTAALITPNRTLARRVKIACQRWEIQIDDSAGQALNQTSLGTFLHLTANACIQELSPTSLLALLKHRLCHIIKNKKEIYAFEKTILRGRKPAPGFKGLYERLEVKENKENLQAILDTLEPIFSPFIKLTNHHHHFRDFLKAHMAMIEALSNSQKLWDNEEGEAASRFLAELWEQTDLPENITARHYADMLEQFFKNITVRPAYGTHPRLMILGQLEARLVDTDLVILGGLNEGTWPPDSGHDPWMSRQMRMEFGLPDSQRSIGLAAHDFVQAFCAPRVVLTRSKRVEGVQSVPARWLQRLDIVFKAAGLSKEEITTSPYKHWASVLDLPEKQSHYTRPEPTPPVEKRPRTLSATRIETWLKDPYAIYARYILKLKKLDPLEQQPDAALRGTMLHEILDHFVTAYPKDIPENANSILTQYARNSLEANYDDPALWSFWWPRFSRLSEWYINHEKQWRVTASPLQTESTGKIDIQRPGGIFTITAKADRIDKTSTGVVIIDYKSGGTYSKKAIITGDLPQLPIEALIVAHGGFAEIPQNVTSLGYWILTGGSPAGKITSINNDIEDIIACTEKGLKALIDTFDDSETPYYSIPRPDKAPRFNDYEHLARVQEWSVLGELDTEST